MKSSSPTINQGQQANSNGAALETFVFDMLTRRGYTHRKSNTDKTLMLTNPEHTAKSFATQVVTGVNIYGTKHVVDFLLTNAGRRTVIECKWQQSNGSVDEKFPFLVACINNHAIDTIVLLDGNGYRAGAKAWLESQTTFSRYLKGVVDLTGMMRLNNAGYFD